MPHSTTKPPDPTWADYVMLCQAEDSFIELYGEMIDLAAMAVAADQRSAQAAERCRALAKLGLSEDAYEEAVTKAEIEASEQSVELYLNAREVISAAFRGCFFPTVLTAAQRQTVHVQPTLVPAGAPDEALLEA